jgi:hypothetical protein
MATLDSNPIQTTLPAMNLRIERFETLWDRVRIRLSSGVDPSEDEIFRELLSHPPPRLERQTNQHWLLSEKDLARWFSATSQEEREAIANQAFMELPMPLGFHGRQTNRHELLSEANRNRYWDARTKDERDAIMIEEGLCPDM